MANFKITQPWVFNLESFSGRKIGIPGVKDSRVRVKCLKPIKNKMFGKIYIILLGELKCTKKFPHDKRYAIQL